MTPFLAPSILRLTNSLEYSRLSVNVNYDYASFTASVDDQLLLQILRLFQRKIFSSCDTKGKS